MTQHALFYAQARVLGRGKMLVGTACSILAFVLIFKPLTQPLLYGGPLKVL